ncbi:CD99 antigen [Neophocaena asiaeorientalis asiaeorientalis]|uniref:CD99 antigen n=1 Tax=Neophocaena asiaeorientalis asiaeorientalis TaxID=1706337 RepID=A0A341CBK0_NEOAA|nr:CD99 antigen [Neophocaena asiaeorientalis asiaeorientalis]
MHLGGALCGAYTPWETHGEGRILGAHCVGEGWRVEGDAPGSPEPSFPPSGTRCANGWPTPQGGGLTLSSPLSSRAPLDSLRRRNFPGAGVRLCGRPAPRPERWQGPGTASLFRRLVAASGRHALRPGTKFGLGRSTSLCTAPEMHGGRRNALDPSYWCTKSQDFDLSHALDDKKPTPAPPKKATDDNFNLEDALGGGNNDPVTPEAPKPKPNPNPNQPGSSGGFSDSDLTDGTSDGGGGDGGNQRPGGAEQAESPGVVPGIIGAVAVAVAGAISSFIAYQKKKLCFRENADQGEMNMENHQGTNAEPPVQQTLLEK